MEAHYLNTNLNSLSTPKTFGKLEPYNNLSSQIHNANYKLYLCSMSKWIFIKFRTSKKLEVIYCLCRFNISHGEPSEEAGLVPCWADLNQQVLIIFSLLVLCNVYKLCIYFTIVYSCLSFNYLTSYTIRKSQKLAPSNKATISLINNYFFDKSNGLD